MLLKPAGQFNAAEAAGGEVEHETLLLVDCGINLAPVEQKKGGHYCVSRALVAVDECVPLSECEAQRGSLLDEAMVEVTPTEGGSRLGYSRFQSAEITNSRRTASRCEHEAVQLDYLTQGEIAHQARRRYNSSNLRTTSAAAFLKSSSDAVKTSATTARASSSGDNPSLSASWRSRSAWAADSSMLSFMGALYRGGAPSNKPLERPGVKPVCPCHGRQRRPLSAEALDGQVCAWQTEATIMNQKQVAENLAAVEAHFHSEAENEVAAALKLYTDDILWEAPALNGLNRSCSGKEAVAENYRELWTSMRDVKFTFLQRFATEDRVVDDSLVTFEVIRDGYWHFPVGSRIEMRLVHIFEMRDGKISRELVFDMGRPRS